MNKIYSLIRCSKSYLLLFMISLNVYANPPLGSVVNLSELGKFELTFEPAISVRHAKGDAILGKVTYKPQSTYKVTLPFSPQQVAFLPSNGSDVKQGEVIAKLNGPEVHHFLEEFNTSKSIYLKSKEQLITVGGYAESKVLKSVEWLPIFKAYHEAKLNFEHHTHVMQQLKIAEDDSVYLLSPANGKLHINNEINSSIFEIVPQHGVFVKSALASNLVDKVMELEVDNTPCKLTVDNVEATINHYKQVVWSRPTSECNFTLGQQLLLRPLIQLDGLSVPQKSIFELGNLNFVAIKKSDKLVLAKVNIIGKDNLHYVVTSDILTAQSEILVSSVSIAQGIFLGLGG